MKALLQNLARQLRTLAPLAMLCALCLVSACGRQEAGRPHIATVNGEKIYLEEYPARDCFRFALFRSNPANACAWRRKFWTR